MTPQSLPASSKSGVKARQSQGLVLTDTSQLLKHTSVFNLFLFCYHCQRKLIALRCVLFQTHVDLTPPLVALLLVPNKGICAFKDKAFPLFFSIASFPYFHQERNNRLRARKKDISKGPRNQEINEHLHPGSCHVSIVPMSCPGRHPLSDVMLFPTTGTQPKLASVSLIDLQHRLLLGFKAKVCSSHRLNLYFLF